MCIPWNDLLPILCLCVCFSSLVKNGSEHSSDSRRGSSRTQERLKQTRLSREGSLALGTGSADRCVHWGDRSSLRSGYAWWPRTMITLQMAPPACPSLGLFLYTNTHHSIVRRIQAFTEMTQRTRAFLTHSLTSEGTKSLFNDLFWCSYFSGARKVRSPCLHATNVLGMS